MRFVWLGDRQNIGGSALEDARSAFQAVVLSSDDFKTRIVGHSILLERKRTLQSILGEQSTPRAREFCQRRHFQRVCSEKLGGPGVCGFLATAWCHKMQDFLNQGLLHAPGFSENDASALAQYSEP